MHSQVLPHRPMKTSRSASLTFAAMAAEYLERMGARMRQRREELELSRDEVARRMAGKTNGNAIYRWERGEHRPQDDTLEELAAVLDVSVSYFFMDEPAEGTPDLMGALDGTPSQLDRIEDMLAELLSRVAALEVGAALEHEASLRDERAARAAAKRSRTTPKRKAS